MKEVETWDKKWGESVEVGVTGGQKSIPKEERRGGG